MKKDKREDLFAATPPLEALKIILSMIATDYRGHKIDIIDIRRAYFHADAIRKVYVKLQAEDYEEGKCGRLRKAMYGTRDAALNWEKTYMEFMEINGFRVGKASACVFYNKDKQIRAVVHGDDFTVSDPSTFLSWSRGHPEQTRRN